MLRRFLLLFLASLVAAASASAQGSPQLTAEQILQKYTEAIGGQARLRQVQTIVAKTVIEQGKTQRPSVIYRKAPNRLATVTSDPKRGETRSGFDGRTLWLREERSGAADKISSKSLLLTTPITTAFSLEPYTTTKLVGIKKVGDAKAYLVRAEREEGPPVDLYFDPETFLLLRRDEDILVLGTVSEEGLLTEETPDPSEGPQFRRVETPVRQQSYYEDYREVSGIKVPFSIRRKLSGTQVTRVLEYQINVPVDDAVFAPPPDKGKPR
ncbi:MAG: hypothetical protein L0212_04980 [Acidobacteria bacterium]|nr:hypothetical protein [Acidobacteriota bacterium]